MGEATFFTFASFDMSTTINVADKIERARPLNGLTNEYLAYCDIYLICPGKNGGDIRILCAFDKMN